MIFSNYLNFSSKFQDSTANLDDWFDGSLLDGRGLLEPVGVDAPQQVLAQTH